MYRTKQKEYNILLINHKNTEIEQALKNEKNHSKYLWKVISKNINKGKETTNNFDVDSNQKANEFNQYFNGIASAILSTINLSANVAIDKIQINKKSMFLVPATAQEICQIVNSLNSTSSVGYDEVPINIIKKVFP